MIADFNTVGDVPSMVITAPTPLLYIVSFAVSKVEPEIFNEPVLYIAPPFPVDVLFFIIESVIVIFASELLLSITEPLPVFSASCIVTFFIFSLTSVPSAILKKLPF